MILSNVNIGTGPSSGDGSPLRSAFSIINNNFQLITNNVNALSNSVSSVAGRTGNVILTINDILGINVYATNASVDSKIAANIANVGGGGSTYSNVNVAAYLTVNGYTTTAYVDTANTALKNYVDGQITAANAAVVAANLGMKGYVDSVATLSIYGNANVASYLPTYGGNIRLNKITFNDLSEQTTAWLGSEWRSDLEANLTIKPSWLSYYPGGSKNIFGTSFGFGGTGMFFTGDANYPAYPIRTNFGFHQDEHVEITTTINFVHQGGDNSIAIFNSNVTPAFSFGANVTRIAFDSNFGTPVLGGLTTANTAPAPVYFAGNVYTVKFVYDRNATPSVTVSSFAGNTATGSPIDVRTLNEQLPLGLFTIGFDGDEDNPGQLAYFTDLSIKTYENIVADDLEIQGQVTGNLIPSANIIYSLGSITNQWRDLFVSNNTIFIGGVPLSVDAGGNLLVNGNSISGAVTGNITVGNSAVNFVANSSGDGNGYSTIELVPDVDRYNSDQYLIVDPTAPGHIHIRAGGTQDNSGADLILGGENSHVKVTAGSNPPIYVTVNNQNWLFGIDGVLQTPGGITLQGNIQFADNTIQTTAADFGYLDLDKDTIKGTAGYQYTFATDGYFSGSTSSESPNYFFVTYNTINTNIASGWTVVGGTANTTVSNVTYPVAGYPGVIRVNLTVPAISTSGFYPVTVTSPDRLRVEIQPNPETSDKFAFTTSGLTFPDSTVQTTAYTGYGNVQVGIYANLSTYAYNANVTAANVGMKGYVDNAVATSGYSNVQVATYLPTYTGNIAAGNVRVSSGYRFETGNVIITNESGQVSLNPDTALSGTAGVKIGGSGFILGPNGARNLTLNYNSVSGALGLQANVTVGTGGSGNLFVQGNIIARDITAGNIIATGTSGVIGFNSGGFVQQATSNATQVTSNTTSGNIQLMNINLGASAVHTVTFACNKLTTNDMLLVKHISGGVTTVYVDAYVASDGLAVIWLRDITGQDTGNFTPMLKYAIVRAPSA